MNITVKRRMIRSDGIFSDVFRDDTGEKIMVVLEHAFKQADGSYAPILSAGVWEAVRGTHTLESGAKIDTFEVQNVPKHSGILFPHIGNWNEDSKGCALSGTDFAVGKDPHQGNALVEMVVGSAIAYKAFMALQAGVTKFQLTVIGFNPASNDAIEERKVTMDEKGKPSTSSVTTGAVTFSAVAVQPIVVWAANGFHSPMPENVSILVAAALVSLGHAAYNIYNARMAKLANKGNAA